MILRNFYTNSVSWGSATSHVSSICEISAFLRPLSFSTFWAWWCFRTFRFWTFHLALFSMILLSYCVFRHPDLHSLQGVGGVFSLLRTLSAIVIFGHLGLFESVSALRSCQPLSVWAFGAVWVCQCLRILSAIVVFGHLGLFESVSVLRSCQPLSVLVLIWAKGLVVIGHFERRSD